MTPAIVNLVTFVGSVVLGAVLRHYGIVGGSKPATPAPLPTPGVPSVPALPTGPVDPNHPFLSFFRDVLAAVGNGGPVSGLDAVAAELRKLGFAQPQAPTLPAPKPAS